MTTLQRDNAELLPCPFCGKPPRVMPINPERDGDAFTAIECANCVSDEMGEQSVVRVMVHADDVHRERAVKLWNTRSLSPQPPVETGDDELIRRELGEAVDALLNAAEVVQLKSINAINRLEALSRKGRE